MSVNARDRIPIEAVGIGGSLLRDSRLRASVRRATGGTRHVLGGAVSADVTSQVAWVEIESRDGAFYLYYFDSNGEGLADTWHETVEQAKEQAQFEFEIEERDWQVTTCRSAGGPTRDMA